MGAFAIGTGEFAIMGMLPQVAAGLDIGVAQSGHVISAYAFGVVVGAPVIAVLGSTLARRTLLLILMMLFAAGNVASALAPDYATFALVRFLSGLPHGAYFGVAALVAAALQPPSKRSQAVGRIMLGLTVATLLGTPLATWMSQAFSWRLSFGFVGALAALTVLLIACLLPADRAAPRSSPLRELGALANGQVWLTLGIGAIGFGGMFAVYSYIASTATEVAGMSASAVPFVVAIFGAGMIVGNVVGARLADRALMATVGGALLWNVVVLALFALTAQIPFMLCLCVFLIASAVAIGPALQIRLMDVAGEAQTLAAALNHSAFNLANGLGAWLGALTITAGHGYAATGWVGAALAVGGLAVFFASLALERRQRGNAAETAY
ncbi:MFS transporter [Aurantimonas sp. Leaf443]|uniref:MFS transporter n=1 Tax=Aurantimonas sp. Leaf443 TaxID=1736378 RepID=UPI0012E3C86E|nr:MFS transporter [Aurantimonas sp. Leaf443]